MSTVAIELTILINILATSALTKTFRSRLSQEPFTVLLVKMVQENLL